ncbi:hypothetical protein CYMTET_46482 [Cymbomonas tetramitiformis]|uniref:Uncharacterized protein n=1 Tax=Cymbomonas tetramitiformis TaxID=36881 RepID=A0AAE0BXF1_9CHLO|nr:hypothetical protein CYMTET_46482 [Cymbomonas tetramitiformis]
MREEVTVPNYLNKFNAPPGHIIIDLQFDLNALRVENVLFRLEAELAPPPHAYPFSEDVPPLRVLSERALFGAFKAEAIAEKDCIHKQRSRLREKYESKVLEEYTTARTALNCSDLCQVLEEYTTARTALKSTREYQDVLCLRKQLREAEDRLEQRELKILHTVTRRDAVVQSQYCREEDALWSRGDRLLEQHQRQVDEIAHVFQRPGLRTCGVSECRKAFILGQQGTAPQWLISWEGFEDVAQL